MKGLTPAIVLVVLGSLGAGAPADVPKGDSASPRTGFQINRPIKDTDPRTRPAPPARAPSPVAPPTPTPASSPAPAVVGIPLAISPDLMRVGLFAMASMAPAAVLMLTAFVRINIVLVLLRQALGSPQVPGNQVLTALALLLTALVMRPVGESVYARAVGPFSKGEIPWDTAAERAVGPIKAFMLEQIERTHHEKYVYAIYDEVAPPGKAAPVYGDEFPVGVVATAFLLSELTTALVIGFYLYLPFLVVDLVVSSVLAAMGLFMLPPSLISLPLKLILFVLADGWVLVATRLLQSFGPVAG